jgi:uncharacterized protein YkwD
MPTPVVTRRCRVLIALVTMALGAPAAATAQVVPPVLPEPAPAEPAPAEQTAAEQTMADLLGETRAEEQLPAVTISPRLSRGCRAYARKMIARDRWAHSARQRRGGSRVAEILAVMPGKPGSDSMIVESWMNSPTHRKVITNPAYRRMGIGSWYGGFQGRRQTVWVVRFTR